MVAKVGGLARPGDERRGLARLRNNAFGGISDVFDDSALNLNHHGPLLQLLLKHHEVSRRRVFRGGFNRLPQLGLSIIETHLKRAVNEVESDRVRTDHGKAPLTKTGTMV